MHEFIHLCLLMIDWVLDTGDKAPTMDTAIGIAPVSLDLLYQNLGTGPENLHSQYLPQIPGAQFSSARVLARRFAGFGSVGCFQGSNV